VHLRAVERHRRNTVHNVIENGFEVVHSPRRYARSL
jgi:hypothetical protein